MTADLVANTAAALRAGGCVFAEEEAALLHQSRSDPAELAQLVARRVAGEPLEHLLGQARFCGLEVAVDAGVFVPRRRTEFLVEQAAARAPRAAVVVDLCCGAGALAMAVAAQAEVAELYAADIEPAAVRCARRNLAGLAEVYQGDLYAPLPVALRGRVDVLLANVPYVPTGDIRFMPTEARVHEPRIALDGGDDGLDVARRVISEAPQWLSPHGAVYFEIAERQTDTALRILHTAALHPEILSSAPHGATVARATMTAR